MFNVNKCLCERGVSGEEIFLWKEKMPK